MLSCTLKVALLKRCGRKGISYFAGSTGLLGHTANWEKFNAYISYFGARTSSRATEVGYVFPMEGIWRDLNPGSLDSRDRGHDALVTDLLTFVGPLKFSVGNSGVMSAS